MLAAAAVKASALVVAPFALLGSQRRGPLVPGSRRLAARHRARLVFFGSAIDEALRVVGDNQENPSYASLPATLSRELGADIDLMRGLCLGAFAFSVALLLRWCARGADWVRAAGWAALGLLLASSYLTPWYVILPLPLAAVARDRALIACAVLVSAYLLRYQVPGLGG